ncbi:hypothetical protein IGI39_004310 [Enterococcus sp. AZ135]|uniref:hypothetical protein n=1 Tax=unclassified Enterococcus TaxID=2608891 RepID=UPI003F2727D7
MKKQTMVTLTIPFLLMYQSHWPVLYSNYSISSIVSGHANIVIEQDGDHEIVVRNYKLKKRTNTQEIEQKILFLQEAYEPINSTGNTDLGNLLGSLAGTITYAAKEPADYFEHFILN